MICECSCRMKGSSLMKPLSESLGSLKFWENPFHLVFWFSYCVLLQFNEAALSLGVDWIIVITALTSGISTWEINDFFNTTCPSSNSRETQLAGSWWTWSVLSWESDIFMRSPQTWIHISANVGVWLLDNWDNCLLTLSDVNFTVIKRQGWAFSLFSPREATNQWMFLEMKFNKYINNHCYFDMIQNSANKNIKWGTCWQAFWM